MRNCEKCGKANQPTRKYCIRCGASLLKPVDAKKRSSTPVAPEQPQVAENATPTPAAAETLSTTTSDSWVRPSEVSRDRVRTAEGLTKPKSEMEKAREAFAKAETVGIDEEDGSGVIETRMLRASEVKELLEGPGMMGEDVPQPTMMEGSEPLPPEAQQFMPPPGPSAAQIEESILGSKSAYVDKPVEPEPEPVMEPTVTPETLGGTPVIEALTYEEPDTATDTGFSAAGQPAPNTETVQPATSPEPVQAAPVTEPVQPEAKPVDADVDLVIACPDCGKVINVDMFEYPKDVYSKMGAARLNQARIFVVQGRSDEAMKSVRMARALYEKADDKKGLKDVLKLVESLAKG
ncbi:MAG: zinc finger Ran-binding domain-containing protein [Promethearchaeota archaeon]